MLELLATGYPSIDTILPVSHCPPANDTGLLGALPEDIAQTYGGCGANVAVGLSRLGYRVGLATLLGADEEGAAYLAHLRAEGVDTRDVSRVAGARSSRNLLMVAPDGEYQNFYFPGASAADWQGEIEFTAMADSRYALVTAGPLALLPRLRRRREYPECPAHLATENQLRRLPGRCSRLLLETIVHRDDERR